jgi:hypothetical protein
MPEEFFDACANLFAFGAEGFELLIELFIFLRDGVLFLAETLHELNGLEDTFLKAG